MQNDELKSLIKDYLAEARLLQVATSGSGQPWICTVYFAFDDAFNLYWISKPNRRHSQEIDLNAKVAGAVVLPHTPGDKVRGVQIEGEARKIISPDEVREYIVHYEERMDRSGLGEQLISGENPHALYTLVPRSIVLFDEVNFPDDPRQEMKLV